jgi:hypothetical protein
MERGLMKGKQDIDIEEWEKKIIDKRERRRTK